MEEIEVDRSAIVSVYECQNLEALAAAVSRGECTPDFAEQAHAVFMQSDVLQTLVSKDVEMLEAMMKGKVH